LDSARLRTSDYDYDPDKIIKKGGQATVLEVTSKIDGKTYAAKKLQYRIGSMIPDSEKTAAAEREVSCLRILKHPMIIEMLDLVKDEENNPWIIMEKCKESLRDIIMGYKE
jgi:serine/threonine protein kinase